MAIPKKAENLMKKFALIVLVVVVCSLLVSCSTTSKGGDEEQRSSSSSTTTEDSGGTTTTVTASTSVSKVSNREKREMRHLYPIGAGLSITEEAKMIAESLFAMKKYPTLLKIVRDGNSVSISFEYEGPSPRFLHFDEYVKFLQEIDVNGDGIITNKEVELADNAFRKALLAAEKK